MHDRNRSPHRIHAHLPATRQQQAKILFWLQYPGTTTWLLPASAGIREWAKKEPAPPTTSIEKPYRSTRAEHHQEASTRRSTTSVLPLGNALGLRDDRRGQPRHQPPGPASTTPQPGHARHTTPRLLGSPSSSPGPNDRRKSKGWGRGREARGHDLHVRVPESIGGWPVSAARDKRSTPPAHPDGSVRGIAHAVGRSDGSSLSAS